MSAVEIHNLDLLEEPAENKTYYSLYPNWQMCVDPSIMKYHWEKDQ